MNQLPDQPQKRNRSPQENAAQTVADKDPLLECLVFLSAHYGKAKSHSAITSGLAYDGQTMRPELFCEASAKLGIKTQIVKKPDFRSLSEAVLPAVLILKNEQAVIWLSADEIYEPQTKATQTLKPEKLLKAYAGYAILVHPQTDYKPADGTNPNDAMRHWFWSLMMESRSTYALVLLAALFINIFALASPLFIMNVYDRVIPNNAIETGWALAIGVLVVFFFDFIMKILRGYLIDVAGRRMDVIATRRIYDQVLNMRLSERPRSAGAFANMLRDFDSVRDFFTSATITVLVDMPFSLFFLFIIYTLGGNVAFILVGILLAVMLVGLAIQVPLKAVVRKSTQSAEAKHGMLVETIHGLETIKALGADGQFRARYGGLVGENAAYGQHSRFLSSFGINFAGWVQQIASVIIILWGMYLVQDGAMTTGGLIACVILAGRALQPVSSIANLLTRYHHASGALKTLDGLMAKKVDRPAAKTYLHRPDLKGALAFDQVTFSYPHVQREILQKVSFRIDASERVGIIGRIGSGKSTIARIMSGLYECDSGSVLLDGTDIRQIDPADMRKSFGYIAQDVVLFNGTVRDNITVSMPTASEEDILIAAKAAGVHDFIQRHPMGYDAPVGEGGEGLSGGQRQAIALARAMLIKPKVLICDEPTNAMDMQAEMAFKHYVKNEIKDRTFILITHKNTLLDLVDRLILLDQGRVIMDGKRDEVIKSLQSGQVEVPQS